MNHRILCSDLDGTLLSTKSDVSDFTIAEINRIKPTTKIILVSARMPKAMRYIQKDLGIQNEPIICYNGALVLDMEKEIHSTLLDVDAIETLYQLTQAHNIKLGLYYKDEWFVEENSDRVLKEILYTKAMPIYQKTSKTIMEWKNRKIGAHKIMLMGTFETIECIMPQLKAEYHTVMNIYCSNDTLIEVSPKSASKLSAISLLIKNSHSLEDVIAFGDNYNDSEMLQMVDCGVAVGNARDEVKAVADYTTLENAQDGVAHFLKLHFKI